MGTILILIDVFNVVGPRKGAVVRVTVALGRDEPACGVRMGRALRFPFLFAFGRKCRRQGRGSGNIARKRGLDRIAQGSTRDPSSQGGLSVSIRSFGC